MTRLQEQPAEGARDVVERELKRQEQKKAPDSQQNPAKKNQREDLEAIIPDIGPTS